jgi:hypothetical protein
MHDVMIIPSTSGLVTNEPCTHCDSSNNAAFSTQVPVNVRVLTATVRPRHVP